LVIGYWLLVIGGALSVVEGLLVIGYWLLEALTPGMYSQVKPGRRKYQQITNNK
jgi:hypothetical protein